MSYFGKTTPTANWNPNAEPDVAGYKVYWGTSSGIYTANATVTGATTRVMTNLSPIQRWYYFSVTAFDTSGNESAFSPEARYYVSDPYTREVVSKTVAKRG